MIPNCLERRGIGFANAAGSNACAVCDYVIAALVETGRSWRVLAGASVGIVGYGHVGRQLAARLSGMGAVIRVYDPLVEDIPKPWGVDALQDVLGCDVVSLHAALHDSACFPSHGLVGPSEAALCRPGSLFINAGRGELLADGALETLFANGVDVVLDTWPGEPNISIDTLARVGLATPHIAGYSKRAKAATSNLLLPSLCEALGIRSVEANQEHNTAFIFEASEQSTVNELLSSAIDHIGGLSAEDARMRCAMSDSANGMLLMNSGMDISYVMSLSDVCIQGVSGDMATKLQSAGCQTV